MIRIKSRRDGFRRAGTAHPGEWTEYPDGRFTAEQMAALVNEPMLLVEVAGEPAPRRKKTKTEGQEAGNE